MIFLGHFYNGSILKGLYLRRLRARFGGWPSPRIELFERVREVSSGYWDPGISVSAGIFCQFCLAELPVHWDRVDPVGRAVWDRSRNIAKCCKILQNNANIMSVTNKTLTCLIYIRR